MKLQEALKYFNKNTNDKEKYPKEVYELIKCAVDRGFMERDYFDMFRNLKRQLFIITPRSDVDSDILNMVYQRGITPTDNHYKIDDEYEYYRQIANTINVTVYHLSDISEDDKD